jgi:hypothetical protein
MLCKLRSDNRIVQKVVVYSPTPNMHKYLTEAEAALRKKYGSRILGVSMLAHLKGKEQPRVRIRSRLLPGMAQVPWDPLSGATEEQKRT